MKELFIMRHARANDRFVGDDFDKPLSAEGIQIQQKIILKIKHDISIIQAIVYSPLKRTKESALIAHKEFEQAVLIEEGALGIHFDSYTILNHLKKSDYHSQLLIGHAPTLALFASSLLRETVYLKFEPSDAVWIRFEDAVEFGQGEIIKRYSSK